MQYMGVWGFGSLYFLILWFMLSKLVVILLIILICGLLFFFLQLSAWIISSHPYSTADLYYSCLWYMYKRIFLILLNLHTHPVVVLKTIWSTVYKRWSDVTVLSGTLLCHFTPPVRRLTLQKTTLWNSFSNVFNFWAFPITSLVFKNLCRVNQAQINKR